MTIILSDKENFQKKIMRDKGHFIIHQKDIIINVYHITKFQST